MVQNNWKRRRTYLTLTFKEWHQSPCFSALDMPRSLVVPDMGPSKDANVYFSGPSSPANCLLHSGKRVGKCDEALQGVG
ncbi:hypothetical protein FKM82_016116 [Ascaphus truei]